MVVRDWLAAMLNDFMQCKRAGKNHTTVMPCSKLMLEVLKVMKAEGYVTDFKVEEVKSVKSDRVCFKKVEVELGKLNKCQAIKPRFYSGHDFTKWIKRYLPARQLGILIVSTSKGIMSHREAEAKRLGGTLLAYCY